MYNNRVRGRGTKVRGRKGPRGHKGSPGPPGPGVSGGGGLCNRNLVHICTSILVYSYSCMCVVSVSSR